ncbi:MAG: hypothetical protein IPM34_01430 [Saprospiraceae bacterium]|nr:hypothetical protein [Saprospiraceae bacterium]
MKQENRGNVEFKISLQLRTLALFYFTVSASLIVAQDYNHLFDRVSDVKTLSIGVCAYQDMASDGITSSFFKDYIAGGFITEEQKDECIAAMNTKNRALISYGGNASVKLGWGGSATKLIFEAGYNSFNEVFFHKDVFVLYFKGNKSYEGKSAGLDPFLVNRIDYSGFSFGLEKAYSSFRIQLKAGLVSGLDYLTVETQNSSLYTAPEGKFVELKMQLESSDLNSASPGIWNTKGMGVRGEIGINWQAMGILDLGFQVRNLGFIDWNDQLRKRNIDTLYQYSGIEIDNLLDTFSITVKSIKEIESDFVKTKYNQSKRSQLPAEWLATAGLKLLNDKLYLNLGVGGIRSDFSQTNYFINSQYRFSEGFATGLLIKKHSYASWDVGAHATVLLTKSIGLQLYWESLTFWSSKSSDLNLTGGAAFRFSL